MESGGGERYVVCDCVDWEEAGEETFAICAGGLVGDAWVAVVCSHSRVVERVELKDDGVADVCFEVVGLENVICFAD